jgi:hypothetical protein
MHSTLRPRHQRPRSKTVKAYVVGVVVVVVVVGGGGGGVSY